MAKDTSKSKIRPLQDRLIVERIEGVEKTTGGLYIPDTAKEKPQQGRVVAVGKGKVREDGSVHPVDVREGDIILFGKYSGTEVTFDGASYLLMDANDILARIVENHSN